MQLDKSENESEGIDMKKTGIIGMIMLAAAMCAMAEVRLAPVPANQAAMVGANYQMELNFTDLTPTTADIAQTNTFTVYGPCAIRWVGAALETDLDDQLGDATTNNVSWTLIFGSTTLVNGVKVSTDQTTTTRRWAPTSWVTGAVAPLYGSATNGVDGMVTVVTNLSTAVTLTASGVTTVASGSTLTITSILTPSGGSPLASMKAGRIRAYFSRW